MTLHAHHLEETSIASTDGQATKGPALQRAKATRALIQHVLEIGLIDGSTQLSKSGKNIVFKEPMLGHNDLASDLGRALAQIKASSLADTYQQLALQPIADTLPEFKKSERASKAATARKEKALAEASAAQQKADQELREKQDLLDPHLDRAYQQAKSGQQPSLLLQEKISEYGSAPQRKRLKAILGIASSNQQALAEETQQPTRAPAPRKTPNPRHLYLSRQVPPLNVAVRHLGQVVVYYELGKEWRLSENDPSLYGHEFLGHEGEKVQFAYHRAPTPQQIQELEEKEARREIQEHQARAFRQALRMVATWVVQGNETTQTDSSDVVIWNNQHGSYWDNQQLSQRGDALVFRHFHWEPFDEVWRETVHIRDAACATEEIKQNLRTLQELARMHDVFRPGHILI
ncbi:hypothetical protein [Deinococcus roseus]|uniref:Uncharacterized protein n=1 Tax=Deinococcus roseus TaxID=392414 RepID=A0ABQ2D3F7_9DEIO|nr:hypothetical protein [Deinococcus roseus]GGJ44534.1 hypothetical protein GCM10008938_33420 [Deinococcus roseus]